MTNEFFCQERCRGEERLSQQVKMPVIYVICFVYKIETIAHRITLMEFAPAIHRKLDLKEYLNIHFKDNPSMQVLARTTHK